MHLIVPVLQEQSQIFLKFSVLLFSLASRCSYDTFFSMNSNQFLMSGAEVVLHNLYNLWPLPPVSLYFGVLILGIIVRFPQ